MNPYLLDFDFRGTLGSVDGSRFFPIFFWNLAEKLTLYDLVLVDTKNMHCHCVQSNIYPLFRLKWPCAIDDKNI